MHAPWQRGYRSDITSYIHYTRERLHSHTAHTDPDSLAQSLERQTEQEEGGMRLLLWGPAEKQSLLQTSLGLRRKIKHQTISQSDTICLEDLYIRINTIKTSISFFY